MLKKGKKYTVKVTYLKDTIKATFKVNNIYFMLKKC